MAISRTPKKRTRKAEQEIETPSIFDHFGIEDNTPAQRKSQEQDKDDRDDKIAELTKRLDDLQRANVALMAQAPTSQTQQVQAPGALDLTGLPDPVAEPDKYSAELNKRINANLDARLNYVQSQTALQQEQAKKYEDLWTDFSHRYGDIAKDEERVQIAAARVIDKARSRGIDVQKFAGAGREQFFMDVVAEHERLFGKAQVAQTQSDQEEEFEEDEQEDSSRSTSILGGMDSGFRPGTKKSMGELGDMAKDIQDIQRKSGFY